MKYYTRNETHKALSAYSQCGPFAIVQDVRGTFENLTIEFSFLVIRLSFKITGYKNNHINCVHTI